MVAQFKLMQRLLYSIQQPLWSSIVSTVIYMKREGAFVTRVSISSFSNLLWSKQVQLVPNTSMQPFLLVAPVFIIAAKTNAEQMRGSNTLLPDMNHRHATPFPNHVGSTPGTPGSTPKSFRVGLTPWPYRIWPQYHSRCPRFFWTPWRLSPSFVPAIHIL